MSRKLLQKLIDSKESRNSEVLKDEAISSVSTLAEQWTALA